MLLGDPTGNAVGGGAGKRLPAGWVSRGREFPFGRDATPENVARVWGVFPTKTDAQGCNGGGV